MASVTLRGSPPGANSARHCEGVAHVDEVRDSMGAASDKQLAISQAINIQI